MPIVHVEMYPGRSNTMKEFLARRIADTVAEVAGGSREGVHVIFHEVPAENWAIGPRIAANRPLEAIPGPDPDAYLVVSDLHVEPEKREEYLAWRRDSVYSYMAASEGFISSTVVALDGKPADYLIINKWATPEAQDRYTGDPREQQLRVEAKEFMDELVRPVQSGHIVDVFHGGWRRNP